MKKFITDGKVVDGAGIGSFDTLDEAKGVWCFWMSVYEIEENEWNDIKSNKNTYAEMSNYLKENYTPAYTK